MTDSLLPLMASIMTVLKADGTLTGYVGQRIYSDVPDNPTFPFVVLTVSSAPYDTKTGNGMEHTAQFSIFSRKTNVQEIGNIRARIYTLLHNNTIALSSASVDSILFTGLAPVFKDPDGQTWQGVAQYRIVIGE